MLTKNEINSWEQVIAKAWQDNAFKEQLKENPVAVLRDQGIDIPPGIQLRVLEDSESVVHLTLPTRPPEQELSDEDLDKVAGGALDRGLLATLARHFGWSAGQVGRILDADQVPKTPKSPSPATDRSPPSMG